MGGGLPMGGLPGGSASRGAGIASRGLGHTPQSDNMGYGQIAGGTLPTGMHSCCKKTWNLSLLAILKK